MHQELQTTDGRTLTLERLDQQQITVLSGDAWPPGSRIDVRCAEGQFAIKVHGCRKLDGAATFRIEGRPVNLGRGVREALEVRLTQD